MDNSGIHWLTLMSLKVWPQLLGALLHMWCRCTRKTDQIFLKKKLIPNLIKFSLEKICGIEGQVKQEQEGKKSNLVMGYFTRQMAQISKQTEILEKEGHDTLET